jgi:hypothetical protein
MDDDVLSEVADNIQSMAQATARLKQVCCVVFSFYLSFLLLALQYLVVFDFPLTGVLPLSLLSLWLSAAVVLNIGEM